MRAIAWGRATPAPVHAELDLADRCNVACYFCNQQDVRTREQIGRALAWVRRRSRWKRTLRSSLDRVRTRFRRAAVPAS